MKRFVPLLLALLMMAACSAPQTPDATESTTTATTNATVQTTTASVTTAATTSTTSKTTTATTTVTTTPAATEVTTEPPPTYSLPLSAEDAVEMVLLENPHLTDVRTITTGEYHYIIGRKTLAMPANDCEMCTAEIHAVVVETGELCITAEQFPSVFEIDSYGVAGDDLIIWQHSYNPYWGLRSSFLPRYARLNVWKQSGESYLRCEDGEIESYAWLPVQVDEYDFGWQLWRTEADLPVGILYDCNAGYDDLSLCFGYDAMMIPGDEQPKVPLMSIDYENGMVTLTFDELQNRIVSDGDLGLSNRFIASVSYKTVGDGAEITLKLTEEAKFYNVDLRLVHNADADREKQEKYAVSDSNCILFNLRFAEECSNQILPAEMIPFCTVE